MPMDVLAWSGFVPRIMSISEARLISRRGSGPFMFARYLIVEILFRTLPIQAPQSMLFSPRVFGVLGEEQFSLMIHLVEEMSRRNQV